MLKLGFPQYIVALLKSLHIDQMAVIRWNGSTTDTFPIGKGVRQSCLPIFSLYTESVMREAEIRELGYSVGGSNIRMCTLCRRQNTHRTVTNGDAATTGQSQRRRCAKASGTKCQEDKTHDHRRCASWHYHTSQQRLSWKSQTFQICWFS